MSIVYIKRWGKARRLRSRKALAHKPTLVRTGKWHSRNSLWAYKRLSRRKRIISNNSRRANRTS